jgi:hypothetical protein
MGTKYLAILSRFEWVLGATGIINHLQFGIARFLNLFFLLPLQRLIAVNCSQLHHPSLSTGIGSPKS